MIYVILCVKFGEVVEAGVEAVLVVEIEVLVVLVLY
jgi:hypothetical protein